MKIYFYSHHVYQLDHVFQIYKKTGGIFIVKRINRFLRSKIYLRNGNVDPIFYNFLNAPKFIVKDIAKPIGLSGVLISGTNTYEMIIDFFSATSTIFNILTFSSIYILRKKWVDKNRPYKALFYPWSMIIVLLLYSSFFIITLITAFIPSIIGFALTLSGTFFYRKISKINT